MFCALFVAWVLPRSAAAQSNVVVYDDSLGAGWNDWSWNCTRDFNNPSPKYAGSKSIAVTYSAWGGFALNHHDVAVTNFDYLEFHVHGGTNAAMDLQVYLTYSNTDFAAVRITNYLAGNTMDGSWKRARIPMGDFNCTSQRFTKINWKEAYGQSWGSAYFDSITLINTNAPAGDTNEVSEFSITTLYEDGDGDLFVSFTGQTSAYYHVWTRTSLVEGAWAMTSMMLGWDGVQAWTNNWTGAELFVRLSGLLQSESRDADDDELTDVYELQNPPLDPFDPDTDVDGLWDGWEAGYGLDPTDPDGENGADGDPDGDGRSNLGEFEAMLNPQHIERNEAPLYLDYATGPWYHDSNGGGWIDLSSASYVLSNRYAMRVGLPSNDAMAILRVVGSNYMDTTGFTNLEFWVNGGPTNGQAPYLAVRLGENTWPVGVSMAQYVTFQSNAWRHVRIPLTHLSAHAVTNLSWIFFKNTNLVAVPPFWVDDMKLVRPWRPDPPVIGVAVTAAVSPALSRRMFGVNVAAWDALMTNAESRARLQEAGLTMLRYPGGSLADYYDWQNNRNKTNAGDVYSVNTSNFLVLADAIGAEKNITVNYGRGSAAEASNWVRHVFGTLNRTVEWWCVGNECFAAWEHDTNQPSHDAVRYAARWIEYRTAMTNAQPGIRVGVVGTYDQDDFTNNHSAVTNPVDSTVHRGWSAVMLSTLARSNQVPDFYELHYYGYAEGTSLLIPVDRASDYHLLRSGFYKRRAIERCREMLCDYFGPVEGSNVAIHVTEANCAGYDPGKQFLSLINGLLVPEYFAQACVSGADAFLWWDLHNHPETNFNISTTLHGWREYGDFGILAVGGSVPLGDAVNEPYPPFYGFKLLTNFAWPGSRLVQATNNCYDTLLTYAAIPADTGSVRLLVVNVSPDTALRPSIVLDGFTAGASVDVYTYGIPEDAGRADITFTNLPIANPLSIRHTFPPYSMTVLSF